MLELCFYSAIDPGNLAVLNQFRKGLKNPEVLKWPVNGDDLSSDALASDALASSTADDDTRTEQRTRAKNENRVKNPTPESNTGEAEANGGARVPGFVFCICPRSKLLMADPDRQISVSMGTVNVKDWIEVPHLCSISVADSV